MENQAIISADGQDKLTVAISGWLHEKYSHSGSERTRNDYQSILLAFRANLHHQRLDLDSDPALVRLVAQAFSTFSVRGKVVTSNTINHRFAVLSSFYEYAARNELLERNPIEKAKRAKVQAYASAKPLDHETVTEILASIDRSTQQGLRDYALLSIAFQTGRRLSELASLQWQHVSIRKGKVTLTFAHAKGNEEVRDTLTKEHTSALLQWLHGCYGADLQSLPNGTPLWVSPARGKSKGKQLGIQAIADICLKRIGTSKVHTIRHSFAHGMEEAGAPVSEIARRLNHKSVATTSIYLATMRQDENKYADKLAELFGVKGKN